jgi:hypothetical protein
MLTKIVPAAEASAAVALERAFAGVFPVSVSRSSRYRKQLADRRFGYKVTTNKTDGEKMKGKSHLICLARCSLLVKLSSQGG